MFVDNVKSEFRIPEDNLEYILGQINTVLSDNAASNRQLAIIAGMLMSISPAVHMAPLDIETLYHAISTDGGIGWDNASEDLSVAKADLQYQAEHLRLNNGKTWLKRDNTLHVCGDASSMGSGAYMPNGEMSQPMVMSFTDSETALMVSWTSCLLSTMKQGMPDLQCKLLFTMLTPASLMGQS